MHHYNYSNWITRRKETKLKTFAPAVLAVSFFALNSRPAGGLVNSAVTFNYRIVLGFWLKWNQISRESWLRAVCKTDWFVHEACCISFWIKSGVFTNLSNISSTDSHGRWTSLQGGICQEWQSILQSMFWNNIQGFLKTCHNDPGDDFNLKLHAFTVISIER